MSRAVPVPCSLAVLAALAACGGGGGGSTPQLAGPARLAAAPVEIPLGATGVDVLIELANTPTPAPALMQVAVEVPPGLALPPTERLQAATSLVTLDGEFVQGRFVVLCGDAQNVDAAPLRVGPLFRLRVVPSTPRVAGTFTLRLHELRAAASDGKAPIAVETTPIVVDVVVR